jgi:hypothetical protein
MVDGAVIERYYIRAGCVVSRYNDRDQKDRDPRKGKQQETACAFGWMKIQSNARRSERRCGFVLTGEVSLRRDDLVGNTVKMRKADRASCDKVPSSNLARDESPR